MKMRRFVAVLISATLLAACASQEPNNTPPAQPPVEATQGEASAPPTAAPATPTSIPVADTAIPAETPTLASTDTPVPTVASTPAEAESSVPASSPKLDLNTATGDDFLAGIPGLGNRMVREFMEYRPYVSILQFRREIGKYVDEAQVAEYEKYVFVPVAINDADAATLQQIPGLTEADAAELIAGRPYASSDAFLAKLAEYVSPEETATAQTFLAAP